MSKQHITFSWEGTSEVQVHKAPKGYFYNITGIFMTNKQVTSSQLIISDENVEEEHAPPADLETCIVCWDLGIDGHSESLYLGENGVKSKYLSGFVSAGANCVCTVFYTLEKASISELIWEFVQKNR